MSFHQIKPTRPCDIWKYSTIRNGKIEKLVFAYDYWSREPVFDAPPHYFVRRSVADALRAQQFTGFETIDVPTITSADYDPTQASGRQPEPVCLLNVVGQHGRDDFGLQFKNSLIVSDRVLELFRTQGLEQCAVLDYEPAARPLSTEEFWRKFEDKN